MATKTKAGVRTGTGKGSRRPPVKVKRAANVPVLPFVVGAILLLFAVGLIIYFLANNKSTAPQNAGGVPCDSLEHTQVHYHAALQIVYQGNVLPIPANVGISGDPTAPTCFYWLHMHAESPGVIHIESPKGRTFTLGDFFKVWQTSKGTPEPLDATHVSSFILTPDQTLVVYVDLGAGAGPQLYTGDPAAIVLKAHEVITLEIGPPTVNPPPKFTFQSGL